MACARGEHGHAINIPNRIDVGDDYPAIAVLLDVTKRTEITAVVNSTVEAFGSLNVMLNNAGINKPLIFMDITEENWHSIMNVNALGALFGRQEVAKQMIKQGVDNGPYKIINVGSILSR